MYASEAEPIENVSFPSDLLAASAIQVNWSINQSINQSISQSMYIYT